MVWATFVLLVILLLPAQLFAQGSASFSVRTLEGKSFYSRFAKIEFGQDRFVYSGVNPDNGGQFSNSHQYELEFNHGVPFIEIDKELNEKWLLLFSDEFLFAYKSDSTYPFFIGVSEDPRRLEALVFDSGIFIVSSFLTQGEHEYTGDNLGRITLWTPWVEGAHGQGIGEYIEVSAWKANRLLFSNGFVSYNKPYLYEYNSRIKKIRIKDLTNCTEHHFTLEDTPCPQLIVLPKPSHDVKILIEEVYAGTKWEDTCVHFIGRF